MSCKKPLFISTLVATLFVAASAGATESDPNAILGVYEINEGKGRFEIFERDGRYFGRIVWREESAQDVHNPDPELRARSLVGVEFIRDFAFDGEEHWVGGTLYAPDSGSTYKGRMWLEGETLKMRGYVGISLFGRTMSCPRVSAQN